MNKIKTIIISSFALLASSSAFAADSGIIDNDIIPINELLVTAATFIGLCLFVSGWYSVKQNAHAPQQNPLSGAFSRIFAGVAMISSGPLYGILSNSTISNGVNVDDRSILSVSSSPMMALSDISGSWLGQHIPQQTMDAVFGFVFLAGLYAFLKGIYLLKNVSGQERQNEGGIGRALTHIGGGFITMNITTFSCMVGNTLGLTMLCIS
ncbi:hypothetical protein [Vibrio owensii]|uniref:hypothetical protein n=1 Tax=Vibrio harveyi group TaxID=717610 RepID=UPI003CC68A1C